MKAVIAIDSFKGSLTSLEAGNSAAAGIRRVFPDAECIVRPLADGGEGTVDALVAACDWKKCGNFCHRPFRRTCALPLWNHRKNKDRHH